MTAYRAWLGTVARAILGVVLIWSSIPKLAAIREFKQTVRAFDVLPELLAKVVGYGLPVVMIILGILLVVGVATRLVAVVTGLLFLGLVVGSLQALVRGLDVKAGVFGVGGVSPSSDLGIALLLAIVFLALSVLLVLWPESRLSIDDYLARRDYVQPPSAKRLRDPQARRKYEQAVVAAARKVQLRTRWLWGSLTVLGLVLVLVGIGVLSHAARFKDLTSPATANYDDGVIWGKDAAATIEIYEDFSSPEARTFATAVAAQLDKDVRANRAQVRYHLVASLDHSTDGSGYSTRAANAAMCAADVSGDFFKKYHDVLFRTDKSGEQVQPVDGGTHSNADFNRYATEIGGLTSEQQTSFRDCVQLGGYKPFVQALTETASREGIGLTPVVLVNGVRLENPTAASLEAAITAAAKNGPAPSPSVTPSATPTPSASPKPSTSVKPSASVPPSASASY